MAIKSVTADRRAQNNLYAGIGAAAAGTAGAAGGYLLAPRAAKSIDDLVFGDVDVFDKTMNKMRNKNLTCFSEAVQTVFPARIVNNSLLHDVNEVFPDEKTPVEAVQDYVNIKEENLRNSLQGFDEVLNSYKLRTDEFTLNDFYTDAVKANAMTEQDLQTVRTIMGQTLGKNVLDAPIKMNDEILNILGNNKKQLEQSGNAELELYKTFLTREKDGIVCKNDMLDVLKSHVKKVTAPFLEGVSFDKFKKFIPKKGAALRAAAGGVISAGIVGGLVKFFSSKKSA